MLFEKASDHVTNIPETRVSGIYQNNVENVKINKLTEYHLLNPISHIIFIRSLIARNISRIRSEMLVSFESEGSWNDVIEDKSLFNFWNTFLQEVAKNEVYLLKNNNIHL